MQREEYHAKDTDLELGNVCRLCSFGSISDAAATAGSRSTKRRSDDRPRMRPRLASQSLGRVRARSSSPSPSTTAGMGLGPPSSATATPWLGSSSPSSWPAAGLVLRFIGKRDAACPGCGNSYCRSTLIRGRFPPGIRCPAGPGHARADLVAHT